MDPILDKSVQTYLSRPLKQIWEEFVFQRKKCPICLGIRNRLVKYNSFHPCHTKDSWHEFQCIDCQRRIGRWSGYFLGEGLIEKKGHYPVRVSGDHVRRRNAGKLDYFNPDIGELPT